MYSKHFVNRLEEKFEVSRKNYPAIVTTPKIITESFVVG